MLGGFSIGTLPSGRPVHRSFLTARTEISPPALRILLDQISSTQTDLLELTELEMDSESILDQVLAPVSPQLATTTDPGHVSGNGRAVSGLTEAPEVGALYLISYEILADGETGNLYFPDAGGSPFSNTNVAPATPGRHNLLVTAKDTDTQAILRISGTLTFGYFSCRKAEWQIDLPSDPAHPELALQREPGRVQGQGIIVSALREPLEAGVDYTLRYEIRAHSGTDTLFTAAGAGSPFAFTQLPTSPGHHAVTLRAQDSDVTAIARLNGDITFGFFSCRRAGGSAGRQIGFDIAAGDAQTSGTIYTRDAATLYVAPWGDDRFGTGAFSSPLATPGAANLLARPGDTVYLRPGTYAPFVIDVSGTADNPITFTTLPGEEHQAVIEGDLMQHEMNGGPGVSPDVATRDGIYIRAQDHIQIRNLSIRNVWRSGIFIVGEEGAQHGHHVIAGNVISTTGGSGIFVGGNNSATILPLNETATMRTTNVLIEHNDVSYSNVVTDYNNNATNPQGVPGGVSEAITVTSGSGDVVTRYNDVHDTRQYGIDYKAGVRGGAIYGNRIWNVERYGIYLDAGRRFVENVDVYNNRIWASNLGIVLSREAGANTMDYATFVAQVGAAEFNQSLANINIYNNLIWDISAAGIFCQRHPQKDGPDGRIENIRIRFNTVYNANRRETGRDLNLSGWSDPDFEAAGVVSGVDFIGNIVWNDTAALRVLDAFSDRPGFSVARNLIGTDPGFTDPVAEPPDLSLPAGTAAAGLVTPEDIATPFDMDTSGMARSATLSAGAVAARRT